MRKYGVSKTAVYTWKRESEEKASALSGSIAAPSAPDDAETQERADNLHRKIGELETEPDFARRPSLALGIEMPAKDWCPHNPNRLWKGTVEKLTAGLGTYGSLGTTVG